MSKHLRAVATFCGCAIAAYLVARLFAHTDASAMWRAIDSGGLLVVLAPAPFALGMTLDAYGTVMLLRALGSRTTLAQMLPVRVASEALHISVPAGFVASDTATAVLLNSRFDVPMRDGVVMSIARKWLVMRAHAVYIAIGALLGFPALAALSRGRLGGALPWIVLASAVVPLAASWVLGAGLLGRSTFARLHTALARLPSQRLGRWLDARRSEAVATDAQVVRLRDARPATASATFAFLGCWCVEAIESALLLRLVGADVALGAVFAVEAGLSLVRALVVLAHPDSASSTSAMRPSFPRSVQTSGARRRSCCSSAPKNSRGSWRATQSLASCEGHLGMHSFLQGGTLARGGIVNAHARGRYRDRLGGVLE